MPLALSGRNNSSFMGVTGEQALLLWSAYFLQVLLWCISSFHKRSEKNYEERSLPCAPSVTGLGIGVIKPQINAQMLTIAKASFIQINTGSQFQTISARIDQRRYQGDGDRVKCFYCNGGLQNWKSGDLPWEEHAKWFPTCEFLLQQKGPDFVHTVVALFPNLIRPVLNASGEFPSLPLVQSGPNVLPLPTVSKRLSKEDALSVAMSSEVVAAVCEMGFDKHLVSEVMSENIDKYGICYQTVEGLHQAVKNKESALEVEKRYQFASYGGRPMLRASLWEIESCDSEFEEVRGNISQQNKTNALHGSSQSSSSLRCSSKHSPLQKTISSKRDWKTKTNLKLSQYGTRGKNYVEELRKTLSDREAEKLCQVCSRNRADMIFVPCGHISCCNTCTKKQHTCPVCQSEVSEAVLAYSS